MLNEAITKLETEMGEKQENTYIQYVGNYMVDYLKNHPDHAEKILVEDKTLSGSMKHMEGVARKKKGRGAVVLTDAEGFKAVLDYYGIEEKEVPEPAPASPKPKSKPKRKVDISLDDLL